MGIATTLSLLLLLLVAQTSAPAGNIVPHDYWMYVGDYTSIGGKGIHLFQYQAATGRVEPAGMATGRLWEAARDSLTGGLERFAAQIRVQWPSPVRMILGVQNPAYLAVHPNGRYLYSADDNVVGTVSAFRINPVTGKLTILSKKLSGGAMACYISTDPAGKNLLVANFGGSVGVLPIRANGELGDATSRIELPTPPPGHEPRAHPHSIVLTPDARFAVVTDMGLDRLIVYEFDAINGTLGPDEHSSLPMPHKSGPRHLRFSSNGKFAYIIGEMGSSISTLAWDPARGHFTLLQTVSTLPKDYKRENATAEMLIHPNGKYLYGTNRGHDSIALFAIDPDKGTLTLVKHQSTKGSRPRGLRFDPTGRYLFAANVAGENVVKFEIDQETGILTYVAEWHAGFPASIRFVPKQVPEPLTN